MRQANSHYVFNIKVGYASELDATVKQLASVGISRIAAVYLNNPFVPISREFQALAKARSITEFTF